MNVDIDDQRRADESRAMFAALVENSGDFIGIGDAAGRMIFVNAAGRRLLEIGSLDAAQATPFIEYFCHTDRAFVQTEIAAALERDGRWVGDFAFRNFRTGRPVPVEYTVFRLLDAAGGVTGIATVSRDRRRRARIEAGLGLLSRTGAAVVDSLDYMPTLRNVARAFVPEFAAYCLIDVITADRDWQRTAVHRDPAQEAIFLHLSWPGERHPITIALETGVSSVVSIGDEIPDSLGEPDRAAAIRALHVRSFITVPVVMPNGEIAGVLTCARDTSDVIGDLQHDDLAFVQEAGRRAGAAIANVRLYERERRIALELQAASLPASLPQVAGLRLAADYRPGSDEATIGGDWYDAFALGDGRIAITVGDVLGHGLRAAVTMTKLRQAMQAAAMVDPDPNVMLRVADQTLRLLDADAYATAIAALYDPREHTLTFASARHPGPFVRRADGEVVQHVSPGLMLGLRAAAQQEFSVVSVAAGASIVFFTDGIVEATRDIAAGLARLAEVIASSELGTCDNPARTIVERVMGSDQASDDIAVLVVTVPAR